MRNIEEGLPLFLFNYSDRKLHGIYEAASHGRMSFDAYAWTDGGSERTPFPAQVLFVYFFILHRRDDRCSMNIVLLKFVEFHAGVHSYYKAMSATD